MCNEVARRIAIDQLRVDWAQLRIPLIFPEGLPNLAALDSIRITDPTVILRSAADGSPAGAEAVLRRWSWPMGGAAGAKPLYNYRSEGRRLVNGDDGGRCLIPVDGFYEFTAPTDAGQKRKTKWLFTPARGGALAGDYLCIAGLWRRDPTVGEAFTMLTTAPGADVAPYHSRQVVLIARADWAAWIDGTAPSEALCVPAPAGSLIATRVGP